MCAVNFRTKLKMEKKTDTSGDHQLCNVVTEDPRDERPTGIPVYSSIIIIIIITKFSALF